jgi:hypothetical protein
VATEPVSGCDRNVACGQVVGLIQDHVMDLWSVLWASVGTAAIGLVALVLAAARRPSVEDLGSVSSHWIAEHRASQSEGTLR